MRPESGVSVVKTSQLLYKNKYKSTNTHFNKTKKNTLLLKARKPQWYMAIYDVCRSRDRRAYFAIVMRPTLFSGLLRVFEWQTMLTASC